MIFENVTTTEENIVHINLKERVTLVNRLTHHKYLNDKKKQCLMVLKNRNNWKVFSHFFLDYILVDTSHDYLLQEDCTFHLVTVDGVELDLTLPDDTGAVYAYLLERLDLTCWLVDFHENRGDVWSNTVYHLVDLLNIILFELRGSGVLREYYAVEEESTSILDTLTPYYLGGHYTPAQLLFFSLEDKSGNQVITDGTSFNEVKEEHTLTFPGGEQVIVHVYDDINAVMVPTSLKIAYDQDSGNYFVLRIDEPIMWDTTIITVKDEKYTYTHTFTGREFNEDCHIVFNTDGE